MFWFAAAGILGWPFAAALCAPFMLEELILLVFGDKTALWEAFVRIGRGVVSAFLLLVRIIHKLFLCHLLTLLGRRLLCQPLLLQEAGFRDVEHS
jgi:hypothetical protein